MSNKDLPFNIVREMFLSDDESEVEQEEINNDEVADYSAEWQE